MSYDEGPRAAVITADDRGAVIDIFAWIFVTFSIIFTLFRIGSNVVRRDFKLREDILIIIATLFATAQSAATSITVINGAGRHQSRLTKTQLARFQQVIKYISAIRATS